MTGSIFQRIGQRLAFALKHGTWKPFIILSGESPGAPEQLLICHRGMVSRMNRFCPHQGAPLETGYFENDQLVCPWHGCKFKLGQGPVTAANRPSLRLLPKILKPFVYIAIPVLMVVAFQRCNHSYQRNDEGVYLRLAQDAFLDVQNKGWVRGALDIYNTRYFRPILHPYLVTPFFYLTGGRANAALSAYICSAYFVFTYFAFLLLAEFLEGGELFLGTLFVGLYPLFIERATGLNSEISLLCAFMPFLYFLKKCDFFRQRAQSLACGLFLGLAICIRPIEALMVSGFLSVGYFLYAKKLARVRWIDGLFFALIVVFSGIIFYRQVSADFKPAPENDGYLLLALLPWVVMGFRHRLKLSENFWWLVSLAFALPVLWFAPVMKHLTSWIFAGSFATWTKMTGHRDQSQLQFFVRVFQYFVWPLLLGTLALTITQLSIYRKYRRALLLIAPAIFLPVVIGSFTYNGELYYYLLSALITVLSVAILALSRGGGPRWIRVTVMTGLVLFLISYRVEVLRADAKSYSVHQAIGGPLPVFPVAHDPLNEIYLEFGGHLPKTAIDGKSAHVCLVQMGHLYSEADWVVDPYGLTLMSREHGMPWEFERPSPMMLGSTPERFEYVKNGCDFVFVMPLQYKPAPVEHSMSDVGEAILAAWRENRLKETDFAFDSRGTYAGWPGSTGEYALFRNFRRVK